MSIGPDISEVLEEVGIAIIIEDVDGNQTTGEYTYAKSNSQVTKPFIREFFIEGWLVYNTSASAGDYLIFSVSNNKYIVMNKSPQIFENEIIKNDVVLYKTNEVVDIFRPSQEESDRSSQTYHLETSWTKVKDDIDVLITTSLFGHDLNDDLALGQISIEKHEMYIPSEVGIQPLDRVRVSSQEYYLVESVKPRRYENVDVIALVEDTRPACSTTTTSTTTTTTTSTTTTTTTTTTFTSTSTTTTTP